MNDLEINKKYTPKQKIITSLIWTTALICFVLLITEFVFYKNVSATAYKYTDEAESISWANEPPEYSEVSVSQEAVLTDYDYVINKSSKKIHTPDCEAVAKMWEDNKGYIKENELEDYYAQGYTSCSICGAKNG